MRILVKKNNDFIELGEGKIYSKSQLKLNELDANLGQAVGIRAARDKAQRVISSNPGVDSASIDAGKADGQSDMQSGEGLKLELPLNANGQQLQQAEKMTKDQGSDDVQIMFKKENGSASATNESRIKRIRENSVAFTKTELGDFLRNL